MVNRCCCRRATKASEAALLNNLDPHVLEEGRGDDNTEGNLHTEPHALQEASSKRGGAENQFLLSPSVEQDYMMDQGKAGLQADSGKEQPYPRSVHIPLAEKSELEEEFHEEEFHDVEEFDVDEAGNVIIKGSNRFFHASSPSASRSLGVELCDQRVLGTPTPQSDVVVEVEDGKCFQEPALASRVSFEDGEAWEKLAEADVPAIPFREFARELLGEDWGPEHYFVQYLMRSGGSNIDVRPPCDAEVLVEEGETTSLSRTRWREITADFALPKSRFCSLSSTRATVTVRVVVEGARVILESSIANHDIPFANSFQVQERVLVVANGSRGAKVTKYWRLAWMQKLGLLKHAIRSSAQDGIRKGAQLTCKMLQEFHEAASIPPTLLTTRTNQKPFGESRSLVAFVQ